MINQQLFGNLPPTEELPYDKCLGFVTVRDYAYSLHSKWSIGQPPAVSVNHAHVYDDPQPIAERELYDYGEIPSYIFVEDKVQSLGLRRELVIPVNVELYAIACQGGTISFELTGLLSDFINFEEGNLKEYERFRLVCGKQSKAFFWYKDCDIEWEQDPETDELVLYPSVYSKTGKKPRAKLRLSCRYPFFD